MQKSYKYRIYPNREQIALIEKHFNCCRFVYNLALETREAAYKASGYKYSAYELIKQLTDLKKEATFLKEVSNSALQQTILDLEKAYIGFYKTGKGLPKFKKKGAYRPSFRDPESKYIKIKEGRLAQSKLRTGIKIKLDRPLIGCIKSSTITKTATGKYFASILCEIREDVPMKKAISNNTSIGIDLGLTHFIITSEGVKIDNPRHFRKKLDRLKVLQRRKRRKIEGSANSKKQQHRINVLHEKITNQRKDFLHKLSTNLINSHDTVCLESLQVKKMMQTKHLALSIADAGWGIFIEMLRYKSEWYGKNLLQLPIYEPSTKVCSTCKTINNNLTLSDRNWMCNVCSTKHDRDINAAINIKQYFITPEGIREELVELPTVVGAWKQEDLQTDIVQIKNYYRGL